MELEKCTGEIEIPVPKELLRTTLEGFIDKIKTAHPEIAEIMNGLKMDLLEVINEYFNDGNKHIDEEDIPEFYNDYVIERVEEVCVRLRIQETSKATEIADDEKGGEIEVTKSIKDGLMKARQDVIEALSASDLPEVVEVELDEEQYKQRVAMKFRIIFDRVWEIAEANVEIEVLTKLPVKFCRSIIGERAHNVWMENQNGKRLPDEGVIKALKKIGVDIDYLMSRDGGKWKKEYLFSARKPRKTKSVVIEEVKDLSHKGIEDKKRPISNKEILRKLKSKFYGFLEGIKTADAERRRQKQNLFDEMTGMSQAQQEAKYNMLSDRNA